MVPTPTRRRRPCMLSSLLFTLLVATQAQAQSSSTPRPDPLDPKAQVPSVRYESAFAKFRRIGDDKPVAWREANDAVARIGGWRVYAREAQQPEPAAAAKQAAPSAAPASTAQPAAMPMPAGPFRPQTLRAAR
jgi:hypothetical protein